MKNQSTSKSRLIFAISILLAFVFIAGSAAISIPVISQEARLEQLSKEQGLEITLVKEDPDEGDLGFIYRHTIEEIQALPYITDCYKECAPNMDEIYTLAGEEVNKEDQFLLVLEDSEKFLSGTGSDIEIIYTNNTVRISGEDVFEKEDESMINSLIIPEYVYKSLTKYIETRGMGIGISPISDFAAGWYIATIMDRVLGYYEGTIYGKHPFLISTYTYNYFLDDSDPYTGVSSSDERFLPYSLVDFTIDPSMNGNIQSVLDEINEIVSDEDAGTSKIKAVVKEGEISETQNNIRLLQLINLAVCILAAMAALTISALFTMRTESEKTNARLIMQNLLPCAIGMLVGVVGGLVYAFAAHLSIGSMIVKLLPAIAVYIAATVVGVFAAEFIMKRRAKKAAAAAVEGEQIQEDEQIQ